MKLGFIPAVALAASIGAVAIAHDAKGEDKKAAGVTMVVTANGFKNTKGQAIVAIYASKDSWLKLDRALRLVKVPIGGSKVEVTFSNLPPGVYAASVIHDENSNGKLDMRWLPPGPAEGAGVSNDATATIGPPSFGDARFRMGDNGASVAIRMRY